MSHWYPLAVPMFGDEEVQAATDVVASRRTTMGERVEEFEEAFARQVGSRYAVMVNSGSSADLLMVMATVEPRRHYDPQPDVIISAVTWPTHVWAHVMAGYRISFADVVGLNTTSDTLKAANTPWVTATSLVHLMGVPAEMDGSGLITEDCCEALGADVGHFGKAAAWSFFFSHHITTMEGGAITTDDPELANRLRSMRSHGWARHEGGDPYTFVGPGFNVRPTEIAAAIGLVQLGRLDSFNKLRAENRRAFVEILDGCPGIEIPDAPEGSNPFGLPFFAEDRDGLALYLDANGVETRPILGGNLLRQPAFKQWAAYGHKYPGADRVHDHGIYVGLHPTADSGVERVAQLIWGFMA